MNIDQELKENMRLYELYSAAALTGYLSNNFDDENNDLSDAIDAIAKQMIALHCESSDRYLDVLNQFSVKSKMKKEKDILLALTYATECIDSYIALLKKHEPTNQEDIADAKSLKDFVLVQVNLLTIRE